MRLFDILFPRRPATASVAKERLQLVIAHERAGRSGPDFLPELQRDLVRIVQKYVAAREEAIEVRLGRNGSASVLEINVELPPLRSARGAA
ncbi:MAG: cell division topological specificity factor MinE [Stellaceae bacterium]